jgi:Asp-tRNA(Asn)/Glu-tRNA(Gln) amidotransferase A subunit family amidase
MDKELKAGKIEDLLHGIPILIKIMILHKMQTTGSLAMSEILLQRCLLVKKLRESGAIIIGKTNLNGLIFVQHNRVLGVGSRGGQTKTLYFGS